MDPIEFMYIVTVAAAMGEAILLAVFALIWHRMRQFDLDLKSIAVRLDKAIPPVKVIFKEVKE